MHFRILSIFLKFRQANKPLVKFSCIMINSIKNYNIGVYKGNVQELSAGCDVIIETSKLHNSRLAKDFEMCFFLFVVIFRDLSFKPKRNFDFSMIVPL